MIDSMNNINSLSALTTFQRKIWAVGGGKGGVGKSLVTANTAITLAKNGFKVIAVDLDLG